MEADLSAEAEEYLEVIYKLQKRKGVSKTNDLAKALNVVPGSITNTVAHLKNHGLVKHEPYHGVRLTVKGEKLALGIIRRHRLAERLLTDLLSAEWTSVHEAACKLEHALTPEVTSLLDEKLGYPKRCPHGNPIPAADGMIKEELYIPLTEARINRTYRVALITDETTACLKELAANGITIGAILRVTARDSSFITFTSARRSHRLRRDLASSVHVKTFRRVAHAVET